MQFIIEISNMMLEKKKSVKLKVLLVYHKNWNKIKFIDVLITARIKSYENSAHTTKGKNSFFKGKGMYIKIHSI